MEAVRTKTKIGRDSAGALCELGAWLEGIAKSQCSSSTYGGDNSRFVNWSYKSKTSKADSFGEAK
jgi:hypothetical protein